MWLAAALCTIAVGVVAATTLVGWHAALPVLVRPREVYGAMQYNTALVMLWLAMSLAALLSGHRRATQWLAVAALVLSGLTVLEHLINQALGLEELFWFLGGNRAAMDAYTGPRSIMPGRMAINSALALSLQAIGLLALAPRRLRRFALVISFVASLAALVIGTIALSGYLMKLPTAYGWGHVAKMALVTSWVITVMGVGAVCGGVVIARRHGLSTRRLLPGLTATAIAMAGLVMWEALVEHDQRGLERAVSNRANATAEAIGREVAMRSRMVSRLALHPPGTSVQERREAADEVMGDATGITSVAWLDDSGRVVQVRTRGGLRTAPVPASRASLALLLTHSRARRQAVLSAPVGEHLDETVLLRANESGQGAVMFTVSMRELFHQSLESDRTSYGYSLKDGGMVLAERADGHARRDPSVAVKVPVPGRSLMLVVSPSANTVADFTSGMPTVFLLAVLLCAVFTAGMVRAAQLSEEQSARLAEMVQHLAEENEARRAAEELRDHQAALVQRQSTALERQNAALLSTAEELQRQRDALEGAQEFGAALVRSATDGVAAFDWDRQVHIWNPAIAALTGLPYDEVDGQLVGTLLPFLNPHEELRLAAEALAGRTTELHAMRASHPLWQASLWLDVTVTPMRGTDGSVVGGLFIVRDVTERHRMERLMLASRDAAEQASRTKSDFLARMSHELRTPLNAVIGFTNVLRRNRDKRMLPDDLTYLARIDANGRHLLALINEVLDLSKIEAGHETVAPDATCLSAIVRDTAAELEVRATDAGVKLVVDAPSAAIAVTDPQKFKQVLINLMGNAIKFTPRGGLVTVRVHTDPRTGQAYKVDVRDTGIGIPHDRQRAIFDAFEQADSDTSRRYGGTGLGLSISRRLCELMGHVLEVESEPGNGATFSILFQHGAEQAA